MRRKLPHYSLTTEQAQLAAADALRDKITDPSALLARLQAGDREATRLLTRGYTWLVWKAYGRLRPSRRIDPADVLSTLLLDLATAVDRLADPVVTPEMVERRLSQHLWHSVERYWGAENSDSIPPKRHDGKGQAVRRTSEHPEPVRWEADGSDSALDPLADPLVRLPAITPSGEAYRVPSRFNQESPSAALDADETFDRLLPHCRSKLESLIVNLAMGGHSVEDIADDLNGVTIRQVERIIARLNSRAA